LGVLKVLESRYIATYFATMCQYLHLKVAKKVPRNMCKWSNQVTIACIICSILLMPSELTLDNGHDLFLGLGRRHSYIIIIIISLFVQQRVTVIMTITLVGWFGLVGLL